MSWGNFSDRTRWWTTECEMCDDVSEPPCPSKTPMKADTVAAAAADSSSSSSKCLRLRASSRSGVDGRHSLAADDGNPCAAAGGVVDIHTDPTAALSSSRPDVDKAEGEDDIGG